MTTKDMIGFTPITSNADLNYGYNFKNPIYRQSIAKWVLVLDYLFDHCSSTKEQIALGVWGAERWNNIVQRGWQSSLFSAMRRKGLIEYVRGRNLWRITPYGLTALDDAYQIIDAWKDKNK